MTARRKVFFAAALVLLGVTAILLQMHHAVGEVPLARGFEVFPIPLDGWSDAGPVPDDVLPTDRQAPASLVRTFRKGAKTLWVSVGYYPKGSPPAELLLPSRGWSTLERQLVVIPLDERAGHSLRANLLVMQTGDRRTAILYWYQIGTRPIASEHWHRTVLLWNRLVHGRAANALVRIASPVDNSADPATVLSTQAEFVRAFYPELLKTLLD